MRDLLEELLAERFGAPVRSDRPRPEPKGNLFEILAEARPEPAQERLPVRCHYAACERQAAEWVDEFAFCLPHKRKHRSEVAS